MTATRPNNSLMTAMSAGAIPLCRYRSMLVKTRGAAIRATNRLKNARFRTATSGRRPDRAARRRNAVVINSLIGNLTKTQPIPLRPTVRAYFIAKITPTAHTAAMTAAVEYAAITGGTTKHFTGRS